MLLSLQVTIHAQEKTFVYTRTQASTDTLKTILEAVLREQRLLPNAASWVVTHLGRHLVLEQTLAQAVPNIAALGVVSLEIRPLGPPSDSEPEFLLTLDEGGGLTPQEETAALAEEMALEEPGFDLALSSDESLVGEVADEGSQAVVLADEEVEPSEIAADLDSEFDADIEAGEEPYDDFAPPSSPRRRGAVGATVGLELDLDLDTAAETDVQVRTEEKEAEVRKAAPGSAPARSPDKGRRSLALVDRRATVRYYNRMNPERMYPLLIILSRRDLEKIEQAHVAQASKTIRVSRDSTVTVTPCLPGCDCYPPSQEVPVGPGEVQAEFWIVPRVLGIISAARVLLRQGGKNLAEIPLEIKVVKQTLVVVMGVLSLIFPFLSTLLRTFKMDFESQLQDGFALYANAARFLLDRVTPETLLLVMLALTGACYLALRPRRRDLFWDIVPLGQRQPPPARSFLKWAGSTMKTIARRAGYGVLFGLMLGMAILTVIAFSGGHQRALIMLPFLLPFLMCVGGLGGAIGGGWEAVTEPEE